MYRRILVPLDGTRFGEHALPYAVGIAARTGAALELVHVHHHRELDSDLAALPQYQYQHIGEADTANDDRELDEQRLYLETHAADLELRFGVRATTRILTGATAEALWHEAQDVVADLVIMATHARQGLARLRYGHVAHELIQHLNVPALCVRPTSDDAPLVAPRIRNVLVALDGSDFSEQILDVAAPLISALGARATLLHVVATRSLLVSGMEDLPRVIPHRAEALEYLESVGERYGTRLPEIERVAVENAEPAAAIASLLAHGGFDLVAMATHGRGGLSRLMLGSIAESVLEKTLTPVLLYRPRLARLPNGDLSDAFRIYGN